MMEYHASSATCIVRTWNSKDVGEWSSYSRFFLASEDRAKSKVSSISAGSTCSAYKYALDCACLPWVFPQVHRCRGGCLSITRTDWSWLWLNWMTYANLTRIIFLQFDNLNIAKRVNVKCWNVILWRVIKLPGSYSICMLDAEAESLTPLGSSWPMN